MKKKARERTERGENGERKKETRVGLNICEALPTPKPMKNESGGKKPGRFWAEEGGSGADYGYTQSLIKKPGPWVFVVSGDGSSCLGRLNNTACLFGPVRPVVPWLRSSQHHRAAYGVLLAGIQGFHSVLAGRTLKEPLVYYDGVRQTLVVTDLSYKSTAPSNSRTVFRTRHRERNRRTQAQKPASH